MNIKTQIQIARGVKSQLPTLRSGELGYATDTNELFIGDPTDGNVLINTNSNPYDDTKLKNDIARLDTQLETNTQELNKEINKINIDKASTEYVDNRISKIVNGSPKGTYQNLSSLQLAKPTGDTGIYITIDNGHWNYWDGSSWVSGGLYQSSKIGDGQVTVNALDSDVVALLNNKVILGDELYWESGSINNTGALVSNASRMRSKDYIRVNKGVVSLKDYNNYKLLVILYDLSKKFISYSNFQNKDFTVSNDCYIKIIISKNSDTTINENEFERLSQLLNIKTTEYEYDGKKIKDHTINIEKVDFISGFNKYNGSFAEIGVSNLKVVKINPQNTKNVVIKMENNKSYKITILGNHNRFIVDVSNSIDIGSGVNRIVPLNNAEIRQKSEYTFVNSANWKYLILTLAYGEPLTTNEFNATIDIYDTEYLSINGEKVIRYKENSLDGKILLDRSISINKLNFAIGQYSDVYTTEISLDKPYSLTKDVYSKYDELVLNYSEYASMNVLGTDSWGNEIREYVFKTPDYNSRTDNPREQSPLIRKPKILIVTGIHGDERSPVLGVYKMAKELCEMESIDKFANLREALEIRIIPCAVPTGYNGNKRLNNNGVNINRNFSDGWVSLPIGNDYAGESPASEKETQIIQEWLRQHRDSKYFMDYHNTGYDSEVTFISVKEGTPYSDKIKSSYFKFVNKISRHWRKDFGLPNNRNIGYSGYFNFACGQRFGDSLGIPSITPEVSWKQKYTSDTTIFGSITNAMTTEFIGNLLIELCNEYL